MAIETESDSAILSILQIQWMDVHLGILAVASLLCGDASHSEYGSFRRKLVCFAVPPYRMDVDWNAATFWNKSFERGE